MPETDSDNINLRSEEVQDILGQVPKWIVRWGIMAIFLTVILIILGSWIFKYPDIKRAGIIVTTENPPATLVARVNGQIEELFVEDNQYVERNSHLAIIENASRSEDVFAAKNDLERIRELLPDFNAVAALDLSTEYQLGEIQQAWSAFLKLQKDYSNFIQLDYHLHKINSIQTEIEKHRLHLRSLTQQTAILARELDLISRQFSRDSMLYKQGVIPLADYEKSESNFLNKQFEHEQSKLNYSNTEIEITKLEQDILDLELKADEETRIQQNALLESYDNLAAQISLWEQKFLLEAPINGTVSFTRIWSENQNVREGDKVLTIIPAEQGDIIGKINLPVEGSGKVKPSQQVNIKFDNYPHMEYGMVKGIINNISLVPDNKEYTVEVYLPDGLTTYYDIPIPFNQEMQGRAEILTDERRLLERIVSPIRSVISAQKQIQE